MLFIRFFKFEFAFIEKIKVIIICASSCFPPSSTFPGRGRRVHPARDQVFQGGGGLYLYRAQAGAVRSSHASAKYALLDIQRELLVDVKTWIHKVDGFVSCPEGGGSALGKETTSH